MARDEENDSTVYKVVVNHEAQYSIWPADRENPLGWRDVGKGGPKAECLAYIEAVWTDMRTLSLRRHMEEMARQPVPPAPPSPAQDNAAEAPLVQRLAQGSHPRSVNASRMVLSHRDSAGITGREQVRWTTRPRAGSA